jgi:aldehyde dehydrogenase (NAD+)
MSQSASKLSVETTTPNYSGLVAELGSAFASGRTRPLAWRAKQLKGLVRMMDECEDELLGALEADLGKPGQEAWMTELSYVSGAAAYARRRLKRWSRPHRVPTPMVAQPARSWVQPEPLGTVLVIGAWNYPLQLTLAGAAAAISAGNCVVLKPSELAPATSAAIARLLPEYVDGDCVRVVEGSVPETTALLEQAFDHILYTGGGTVGRIVMRAAAEHLTPVTLELGGKSPCVVMPDADLETAASRIAWGKFTNAGQTCVAPDYVLTDAETERRLVPLIEKAIRSMFGDDPSASESYGRIINERHFDRLAALLEDGKLAVGGRSDRASRYIEPTVLTDVSPDSPVMQDEIFGPVLPVLRADDLDAAIAHIRRGDKPLSAYLFTRSSAAERRFVEEVSCGNLCLNDTMMFMAVEELPFGGVGASGMGAYSGRHGFDTFSHLKAVIRRSWWPEIPLRYAPFSDKKWNLLRKLR